MDVYEYQVPCASGIMVAMPFGGLSDFAKLASGDFIVGQDKFDDLQINKVDDKGFHYFKDRSKPLASYVERFVLKQGPKSAKVCFVKLIQNECGRFEPRFKFEILDLTKKALAELDVPVTKPEHRLVKARVDLDDCHDELSQLVAFINACEDIEHRYVVARRGEVLIVDDTTKHRAIQEILDRGYSEDFWTQLIRKNPDLATRLAVAQVHADRQTAIQDFEESITTYSTDEGYWQSFFEKYPWILEAAFSASVFMLAGETYLGGKRSSGRNGAGGVATDYLFGDESTKSFAVIDIKTPAARLIGPIYRGDRDTGFANEVYSMHADLSGGVVQVRNQISVAVEHFQSVLGEDYRDKINRVHPRGVLIAGVVADLTQRQRDSFNQFRQDFHSLTIITFDELLNRLKKLYDLSETSGVSIEAIASESIDDDYVPF